MGIIVKNTGSSLAHVSLDWYKVYHTVQTSTVNLISMLIKYITLKKSLTLTRILLGIVQKRRLSDTQNLDVYIFQWMIDNKQYRLNYIRPKFSLDTVLEHMPDLYAHLRETKLVIPWKYDINAYLISLLHGVDLGIDTQGKELNVYLMIMIALKSNDLDLFKQMIQPVELSQWSDILGASIQSQMFDEVVPMIFDTCPVTDLLLFVQRSHTWTQYSIVYFEYLYKKNRLCCNS